MSHVNLFLPVSFSARANEEELIARVYIEY